MRRKVKKIFGFNNVWHVSQQINCTVGIICIVLLSKLTLRVGVTAADGVIID